MASRNCGRLGRKSTLPTYSTKIKTNECRTALLPTLPSSTGKTARDDTMQELLRRRKRRMRRHLRVSRTASTVSTNEVHDGSGTGLDMIYSTEHELSRLSTGVQPSRTFPLVIFIAALGNTTSTRSSNPAVHTSPFTALTTQKQEPHHESTPTSPPQTLISRERNRLRRTPNTPDTTRTRHKRRPSIPRRINPNSRRPISPRPHSRPRPSSSPVTHTHHILNMHRPRQCMNFRPKNPFTIVVHSRPVVVIASSSIC